MASKAAHAPLTVPLADSEDAELAVGMDAEYMSASPAAPAYMQPQHIFESCTQAVGTGCCMQLPVMTEDVFEGLDEGEIDMIFWHELAVAAWDKNTVFNGTWLQLEGLAPSSPQGPRDVRGASWGNHDPASPWPLSQQPQHVLSCRAVGSAQQWHPSTRPVYQVRAQEEHQHPSSSLHHSCSLVPTESMASPLHASVQDFAADGGTSLSNAVLGHRSSAPCDALGMDMAYHMPPVGRCGSSGGGEVNQQALQQKCQHSTDLAVVLPPCAWHPGLSPPAEPELHSTAAVGLTRWPSCCSTLEQLRCKMRQLQAELSRVNSLQAALASWEPVRAAALARQVLTSNSINVHHSLPSELH